MLDYTIFGESHGPAVGVLVTGAAPGLPVDRELIARELQRRAPHGPLALADLVGLDICLAIMETIYTETGDSKYRPALTMKKMVRAGLLGQKTGEGFYKY